MTPPPRCLVLAMLLFGLATLAPAAPPAGAQAPPLDALDAEVRAEIETARRELATARSSGTEPAALAAAAGNLGALYLRYDFSQAAEPLLEEAAAFAPTEHRWLYFLGMLRQGDGRLREAVEAYKAVLAVQRGDLPTVLRLADLHLELGEPELARVLWEASLENELSRPAAEAGLGRIALAAGRPAEALDRFRTALELQPTAEALRYEIGLALRELGRLAEAREALEQRGELQVSYPDPLARELRGLGSGGEVTELIRRGDAARRGGDPENALAFYRGAVEADPSHKGARRSVARTLEEKGDFAAAAAERQRILDLDPDDPKSWRDLAIARLRNGEGADALELLRRSVELDPSSADARLDLGVALIAEGRLEEALPHLAHVVELDPRRSEARMRRAQALDALGRSEEAVAELETLLEVEPHHAAGLAQLGRLRLESDRDPSAAAPLLRRAAEAEGAPPSVVGPARLRLARIAEGAGDREAAVAEYREALRAQPDQTEALLALSRLLPALGEEAEAIYLLKRHLKTNPDDHDTRLQLGLLLLALEREREALPLFEELEAARPDDVALVVQAARLRGRLGYPDRALEELRDAVSKVEAGPPRARILIEMGIIERRRSNFEAELGHYRAAVDEAPDLFLPSRELAAALGRAKRFSEAAAAYREALMRAPDNDGVRFEAAMSAILAGHHAAAVEILEEGLEGPASPPVVHLLARLLATSDQAGVRDGERAVELARAALARHRDPGYRATLVMALASAGQWEEAVALQETLVTGSREAGLPEAFVARLEADLARYRNRQLAVVDWSSP